MMLNIDSCFSLSTSLNQAFEKNPNKRSLIAKSRVQCPSAVHKGLCYFW